jgi:hypothetical protein
MECINCNKHIRNGNTACYARFISAYFCSLTCLTDYAHEYFLCEDFNEKNGMNGDTDGK